MNDSDHKHNFHTHTYRCKHAEGDVADYCAVAMQHGMKTLGLSDHSALPDDRWRQVRMPYAELDGYIAAIDQARLDFPTLDILKGMECEYIPRLDSYYADELLGERGFDYLVGASHFFLDANDEWHGTYGGTRDAKTLREYTDYTIRMMETGYFDFIAHPDLFGNCYKSWDADTAACSRDLLTAARELDVGMEINALGLRKQAHRKPGNEFPLYPWIPFWEIAAEVDAPVIVNSDAHRPKDLQARTAEAYSIRDEQPLHADMGDRRIPRADNGESPPPPSTTPAAFAHDSAWRIRMSCTDDSISAGQIRTAHAGCWCPAYQCA